MWVLKTQVESSHESRSTHTNARDNALKHSSWPALRAAAAAMRSDASQRQAFQTFDA
jgi:hypothetical protein